MKKSNNPFKMWGSYVGLILGIIFTYINFTRYSFWNFINYSPLGLGIIAIPTGFLLGYLIHYLIRRYLK